MSTNTSDGDGDEFNVLQQAVDETVGTDVLSDNKVEDLVTIANGNVIGNEQQTVLCHLGLCTGWLYPHDRNVNTILTGPSAGGKSHSQGTVTEALPSEFAYDASDASSMGVLDDEQWDNALYAPLDEWQKIPDKLTEIMKGVAGGPDDEYRYVRSVSSDDAESGREGHTIIKKAKPFTFLYAQHALDHELSTRLVFLPIDDDVAIREAIVEVQGGAKHISVDGFDKEFIFDTDDEERALRQHLRELPTVRDDDGNIRGGVDAVLPPWIRKSVMPILDMSRTETNRVSGQVFNLIRASAVVNHDDRREVTVEHDGREFPAFVAAPEDAANVLSCRETLLAKTHHLDDMKREVLDAIRANQFNGQGDGDGVGVTLSTIRDYLDDSSGMSVPRKEKLRELLKELSEHYYVDIHERAGPNGSHLYEFKSLRDIGVPRVTNLTEHLDDDELQRCNELCPDVDLDNPYDGVTDPFRDQPFVDTVEEMRDEFASNPLERTKEEAELVSGSEITVDPNGDLDEAAAIAANNSGAAGNDGDDGANMTLDGAMGDGSSSSSGDGASYSGGSVSGPVEQAVYELLQEHAHDRVWSDGDDVDDLHLIGVVEEGESVSDADVSGSIADPSHDVWSQPHKPDDWVTTRGDAEREITEALDSVLMNGLLMLSGRDDGSVRSMTFDASGDE